MRLITLKPNNETEQPAVSKELKWFQYTAAGTKVEDIKRSITVQGGIQAEDEKHLKELVTHKLTELGYRLTYCMGAEKEEKPQIYERIEYTKSPVQENKRQASTPVVSQPPPCEITAGTVPLLSELDGLVEVEPKYTTKEMTEDFSWKG